MAEVPFLHIWVHASLTELSVQQHTRALTDDTLRPIIETTG